MKTVALRHLSSVPIRNGLGLPGDNADQSDPRYIRTTDIATPTSLKEDTFVSQPTDIAERAPVEYGDLLLVSAGASIGKSYLHLAHDSACYAGFLTRVRPKSLRSGLFLSYWTQSSHYNNQIRSAAVQSTIENFSSARYKELQVPDLPDVQQDRIVKFLDTETAKIDHLIAKQRELISLLEERLSAFMENALVKGISHDNASPMEWRRVKHLFKLRDERNRLEREEVTLLSLYAKHGVRKYDEIEERTGNPVRTVQDYKCVHAGDIIVNIILAWMGSIGRSPHDGVISPAYDIWTPLEGVSSRYYHYLFRTKWFSGECYKRGKGIMMMRWRTYADQFGDIRVPFPTQQEQDYLVNLIEREESQVQNLISKCQRMIDLLQERRSALITAAVTGQIEV